MKIKKINIKRLLFYFNSFIKRIALYFYFKNAVTPMSIIAGLALNSFAYAGNGISTANYLKVDVGARAVAMGGSQFGSENDGFAMHYNPSLISGMAQKEISFMHNQYFEDLRQDVAVYSVPTERKGNFAAGVNYFTYGKIAGYNAQGAAIGDLTASDLAVHFGWAKSFDWTIRDSEFKEFSFGANIKLLQRTLADSSANGFALDLGFSYPLQSQYLKNIKLAGAVQNLGPGIKFKSETSPLPQTIRAGFGRSFWGRAFTFSADLVMRNGESMYPAAGLEYRLLKIAAVRVGYKGSKNLDNKLTYGVGLENPLFKLDYAFVPFGNLGTTHRVSFAYSFGRNVKRSKTDTLLQEKVREAKTMYAQGLLVDAYVSATQIQRVAPWIDENNKLVSRIQKSFKELEENDRKEKLNLQIQAILSRGEKFFEQGNLINARIDFQSVLGLQPDNKAAQGYLRQIEAQFNSFVESFYRTGMVAFAAENYERAKEEFEKVLVIDSDHTEAKAQLSRCISILEKKEQEIADAVRQDTITRTYKEALKAYQQEKYEESIPLFNAVVEMSPDNEEARRYLASAGEVLFKKYAERGKELSAKGEWESAIKNLKAALEYNPGSRDTRSLLADIQRRWDLQKKVVSQNLYKEGLEAFLTGDKQKAKEIWQRAITLDPENEEAKRGLARVGN